MFLPILSHSNVNFPAGLDLSSIGVKQNEDNDNNQQMTLELSINDYNNMKNLNLEINNKNKR